MLTLALLVDVAAAATYRVGPNRPLKAFADLPPLNAGDVVEVDGDATYAPVRFRRSGTAANPIIIRGVRVNGKRPTIRGGDNTVHFQGHHYVFEGFTVTRGARRCVFHNANDITIRDSVIHDCPGQGILGSDEYSGSLTLQYVEIYRCGGGDRRHQIYMATDQRRFPGSVFRMEYSYIHSGTGGNNVKSRAERNEIYYNWIEGAYYHELELIGPAGGENLKREDSDVVGNVIRKTGSNRTFFAVRIGGDGTGQTWGRYRFVNNTFLHASGTTAVFRLFHGLESVEMHNNVFFRPGGGGVRIYREQNARWATGSKVIAGRRNWVAAGSTSVPSGWQHTTLGTNPGFVNLDALDLRPRASSALVDAGQFDPPSPSGHPFPSPRRWPTMHPPDRTLLPIGAAVPRPMEAHLDIGAFEYVDPNAPGPEDEEGEDDYGEDDDDLDEEDLDPDLDEEGDDLLPDDDTDGAYDDELSGGCSAPGGGPSPVVPTALLALLALALVVSDRRRASKM